MCARAREYVRLYVCGGAGVDRRHGNYSRSNFWRTSFLLLLLLLELEPLPLSCSYNYFAIFVLVVLLILRFLLNVTAFLPVHFFSLTVGIIFSVHAATYCVFLALAIQKKNGFSVADKILCVCRR